MKERYRRKKGLHTSFGKTVLSFILAVAMLASGTLSYADDFSVGGDDFSVGEEWIGQETADGFDEIFSEQPEEKNQQDSQVWDVEEEDTTDLRELSAADGPDSVHLFYTAEPGIPKDTVFYLQDPKAEENRKKAKEAGLPDEEELSIAKAEAALGWQAEKVSFHRYYAPVITDPGNIEVTYKPEGPVTIEIRLYDEAVMDEAQKKEYLAKRERLIREMHLENLQIVRLADEEEIKKIQQKKEAADAGEPVYKTIETDEYGTITYQILNTTLEDGTIRFQMDQMSPFICLINESDGVIPAQDFFSETSIGENLGAFEESGDITEISGELSGEVPDEITEDNQEYPEKKQENSPDNHQDHHQGKNPVSDEPAENSEEPKQLVSGGDHYEVSVTYDAEANIPEGSELIVSELSENTEEYDYLTEKALAAIDTSADEVLSVKLVDVSITNDGNRIEPETEVGIALQVFGQEENSATETMVISIGETTEVLEASGEAESQSVGLAEASGGAENQSVGLPESSGEAENQSVGLPESTGRAGALNDFENPEISVDFEALDGDSYDIHTNEEDFRSGEADSTGNPEASLPGYQDDAREETSLNGSFETTTPTMDRIYAIVEKTFRKELLASDGNTYEVTVTYQGDAQIPVGAELEVKEIPEGSEEYASYMDQTADAISGEAGSISYARMLDISIVKDGEEIQVAAPVEVKIQLKDTEVTEEMQVVHIGDMPERMETEVTGDALSFWTDGFSVYVVVGTTLEQKLTASDGNEYLVTVTYDSASGIPANAELIVSEIKEDDAGYDQYVSESAEILDISKENVSFVRAFDITLKDPETGEKFQPTKDVQVSIELLSESMNENTDVSVVHFGEETEIMDASINGESVEFETSGFSVYVIISGDTPLRTYSFYTLDENDNYVKYFYDTVDGVQVYQQTVKGSEKPVMPQLPSHTTKTFAGWFVYDPATDSYADEPYDFDNAPTRVTVTEEIILRARFANYGYVIFHDQYNGSSHTFPIAATRRGEIDDETGAASVTIGDMEVAYDDSISKENPTDNTTTVSKMIFYGWSVVRVENPGDETGTVGETPNVTADVITASSDFTNYTYYSVAPIKGASVVDGELTLSIAGTVHLYPIFIGVHWLDFYTAESGQGASYFAPIYYTALEGEGSFDAASDKHPIGSLLPTRPGYTFDGWYTGQKVFVQEKDPDTHEMVDTAVLDHIDYGTKIVNANGSLAISGSFAGDAYVEAGDLYVEDGLLKLNKDVMLFARWTLAQADYTVVIWKQNVSGDGYDFAKSYTLSANTNSSVGFTGTNAAYIGYAGQIQDGISYEGFHLGHYDEAKTVNGNGSTILNVYYDRDMMTINFLRDSGNYQQDNTNGLYGRTSNTYHRVINNNGRYYYLCSISVGLGRTTYTLYTGTIYVGVGNSIVAYYDWSNFLANDNYYGYARTSYNDQTAYLYGNNGYNYIRLSWREYTGKRYSKIYNTMFSWTGLFGQTFEEAGYDWDTVAGYLWGEAPTGGTVQTLLDGFTRPENPYNLYYLGENGTNSIYHFKQNVDGTYTWENRFTAHTTNTEGTFYFSNKFDGFTVSTYTTSDEGFSTTGKLTNGTFHSATSGSSVSTTYPLYVYHTRNPYTIRFLDSIDNREFERKTYVYGAGLSELDAYEPDESEWPNGNSFVGWYADASCSTRVFFHTLTDAEKAALGTAQYVEYPTMPAGGFQIFAGWSANDYLVIIDPNGGQLTATESTWFFATYGDPDDGIIKVYEDVTRNFIETADPGSETPYYYSVHDREWWYRHYGWTGDMPLDRNEPFAPFMPTLNGAAVDCNGPYTTARAFEKGTFTATGDRLIPERGAGYTPDETASTDGKIYIYSAGAYRFSGWYEIELDANGNPTSNETIYRNDSNEYVDHVTYLRAHWKQVGTYRLQYDPGEDGTLDGEDSNSDTYTFLEDEQDYIDKSNVVVTRSVTVKEGKLVNFVGWTIRGDSSGKIYAPGEALLFPSQYATRIVYDGGTEEFVLYLDAVYKELSVVKLIYDANGGTINENAVDYGTSRDTDPDRKPPVTSVDGDKAIVLGMRNNTGYVLSNGTGFSHGYTDPTTHTYTSYELTGWNTEPDGSGTHFPLAAYSEDVSKDLFLDVYDGDGGSKPVTLYAEWKVRVYFDKNKNQSDWGVDAPATWAAPYEWDNDKQLYYIVVNINSTITEPPYTPRDTGEITAEHPVLFNFAYWSGVRYTDDAAIATEFDYSQPITGQITLYGFWRSPIEVPYHVVDASAEALTLKDSWRTDPYHFSVTVGSNISLSDPVNSGYVELPTGKPYTYAFACLSDHYTHITGDNRITAVLYDETNRAAAVSLADGTEQVLDSGVEIYLVYYEDPLTPDISYVWMDTHGSLTNIDASVSTEAPKVVSPYISAVSANGDVLPAQSSASAYVMGTQVTSPIAWAKDATFRYYAFAIGDPDAAEDADLNLVTEIQNSDGTRPVLQIRNSWRGLQYSLDGSNWSSGGYGCELYVVYFKSKPTIITLEELTIGTRSDVLQEEFTFNVVITEKEGTNAETSVSSNSYTLKSGENRSVTLFYTEQTVESPEIIQKVVITEARTTTQAEDYKTERSLDNGANYAEETSYTYTTSSASADHKVIFKNTRRQKEIELHIAYLDADGYAQNDTLRTASESIYKVVVPIYGQVDISGKQSTILTGSSDEYKFYKLVTGIPDENGVLSNVRDLAPGTVHFGHLTGSDYYDLYLDSNPEKQLANDEFVYYVFYRMPRIYYVKESGSGALSVLSDPLQSGDPAATITQLGTSTAITNGQLLPLTDSGTFLISQINESGRNWMMANFLNDAVRANNLKYMRLGVGTVGTANRSGLQEVSTDDLSMSLKVLDGQVQYSYNGTDWAPFHGAPAVYAIYRERGCDLHIQLTVDDESLQDTPFTVVVYSTAITEQFYSIANYEELTSIAANTTEHTITLEHVKHGCDIVISGLQTGTYTVTETVDLDELDVVMELDDEEITVTKTNVPDSAEDTARSANISINTTTDTSRTLVINNKRGAMEVMFKKIDGFGNALGGANFSLYLDYAGTAIVQITVNNTKVTSVTSAAAFSTADDDTKYNILFKAVPGLYYMRETNQVSGYQQNNAIYRVIVGETGYTKAGLTKTASDPEVLIQRMTNATTVDTVPDIAAYGIMNISAVQRKAILKKVSNTYMPLSGAQFQILRFDRTLVSSTDINGATTTTFTSGTSGVYFIDELPFGTYYIHETVVPEGYQKLDDGTNWFVLTVNADGVNVTGRLSEAP